MASKQRQAVLDALDVERFYTEIGDLVLQDMGNDWQGLCPFHEDSSPSFTIRKKDGVFKCFGCEVTGSVFDFYAKVHKCEFAEAFAAVAEFAGVEADGPAEDLETKSVEQWHKNLMKNKVRLEFLQKQRGLTLETIKKYKIGHNDARYTIPVYEDGQLVNVRQYLPSAPRGVPKVIGLKGRNERRLLFRDVFGKGRPIVLCEGEMDTILARQSGVNATTVTSGAGNWVADWNDLFKGEDVILSYDNDKQGRVGNGKVGSYLATTANSVRIVRWPEGFKQKGDVTDFILANGPDGYKGLLESAVAWEPQASDASYRYPLTDLGNAERLIERHGSDFIYISEWKKFVVWNGQPKWIEDNHSHVNNWAFDTVRGMVEEAKALKGDAGEVLSKWQKVSESAGKLTAMVELAGAKVARSADELNRDPWILNTPNGVVNLKG